MKRTVSSRTLRLKALLLHKQEEITRALRNHRLTDTLAVADMFDGVEQREIDLRRFTADSEVLAEIRSALDRVASGSFGVCEDCGELIPARRLQAVPWTRYCVACQESIEQREREAAEETPYGSLPRSASGAAA